MPSAEDIAHLRLIRTPRIGPKNFRKLVDEYGSAEAAVDHVPKLAEEAGVKGFELIDSKLVKRELAEGQKATATPYYFGRPTYPSLLGLAADAPPFFWARGDQSLLKKRIIALVGSRNASSLGVRFARSLSKTLGENGLVVASGLARGIDMAVHDGALETGTIAVQAGGLNAVYPPEAKSMHEKIQNQGLLISEHPFGMHPQARHFPRRNHILAALSEALIVIEGATGSGSLITARASLDLGREVMAVPGHPFDSRASGCNALLRDGATLVRGADDVLEALANRIEPEPEAQQGKAPVRPIPSKNILSVLGTTPCPEDVVIRDSGLPTNIAAQQISSLELEGRITRDAGGRIALSQ